MRHHRLFVAIRDALQSPMVGGLIGPCESVLIMAWMHDGLLL